MKRPKLEDFHFDFKYHGALEEYCTLLEETISALKDEHAEVMQNYTDCVNYNKHLEDTMLIRIVNNTNCEIH
jgi:hypothetical protein